MNTADAIRQKYIATIHPTFGDEGCAFFDNVMSMSLALILIIGELERDTTRRVLEATINRALALAAECSGLIDHDIDEIMKIVRKALDEIREHAHASRHH